MVERLERLAFDPWKAKNLDTDSPNVKHGTMPWEETCTQEIKSVFEAEHISLKSMRNPHSAEANGKVWSPEYGVRVAMYLAGRWRKASYLGFEALLKLKNRRGARTLGLWGWDDCSDVRPCSGLSLLPALVPKNWLKLVIWCTNYDWRDPEPYNIEIMTVLSPKRRVRKTSSASVRHSHILRATKKPLMLSWSTFGLLMGFRYHYLVGSRTPVAADSCRSDRADWSALGSRSDVQNIVIMWLQSLKSTLHSRIIFSVCSDGR